MGEEVRISDYDGGGGGKDDERVLEWEVGLPNADDLTPLCQSLIPAELASAFSITPEPRRSMVDVNRASQNTLSNLQGGGGAGRSLQEQHEKLFNFKSFSDEKGGEECDVEETELTTRDGGGSDSRTKTRNGAGAGAEEADSAMRMVDNFATDDSAAARTLKRPRLVWTPQLHKRFVDVVAHLGVKNAVPKTIMQLMNVEGLTRENVASHLQKYRLYLKRMQGLSNEGPSSSDHLFASTPLPPQSLHDSTGASNLYAPPIVPMPYAPPPQMVPVPHGFESHHHHHPSNTYNNMMMMTQQQQHQHQRDWSGNHFGGPIQSYHHRIAPTDK